MVSSVRAAGPSAGSLPFALLVAVMAAPCSRPPTSTPVPTAPPSDIGSPASSVTGPCGAFYPAGFSLLPGTTNDPVPFVPRPAKGFLFADPTYRTCLVRATDHARDGLPGFARNDYSRRQAFNADDSRFLAYAEDGSWHLYDARTLAHMGTLPGLDGDAEPQWHPADPDIIHFLPISGGLVVNELTVSTGRTRVVGDFRGRLPWASAAHVWTRSEGSPSADARFWAFMVEDEAFAELGLIVWDREADAIVATHATSRRPDHVSMSPSGNHVVVSWDEGVVAFDRYLRNARTIHAKGEHSDIAVDAAGDDVHVSVDYDSDDGVANGYWTEPQATVNRDFTRILFNSNWGVDSSTDVDAYMVSIPAGAVGP